jgi:hypothetical protein
LYYRDALPKILKKTVEEFLMSDNLAQEMQAKQLEIIAEIHKADRDRSDAKMRLAEIHKEMVLKALPEQRDW